MLHDILGRMPGLPGRITGRHGSLSRIDLDHEAGAGAEIEFRLAVDLFAPSMSSNAGSAGGIEDSNTIAMKGPSRLPYHDVVPTDKQTTLPQLRLRDPRSTVA
jgi:hypothetical protein